MRQLNLCKANSTKKITKINLRLTLKICDPSYLPTRLGAPHTDSFLKYIGEPERVRQQRRRAQSIVPKGRIEFFNNFNSNLNGGFQYA